MRLCARVAGRLGKKLRLPDVFRAGQKLGAADTAVEPATVGLAPTGKTGLNLDRGFAARLQSFFVAVNPSFPGDHPGAFSFPIGDGMLAPNGSSGMVKTTGGIEFIQVGGGQFFIRNLEPELATATANAEYQLALAASGPGPNAAGPLLGLGAGTFAAEPIVRTITEAGAPLTLSTIVAQGFNEAFCKPLGGPTPSPRAKRSARSPTRRARNKTVATHSPEAEPSRCAIDAASPGVPPPPSPSALSRRRAPLRLRGS